MSSFSEIPPAAEFARWRGLPPDALPTNADIGSELIEPLMRWAIDLDATITEVLGGWVRDFKLDWPRRVDFILLDRSPQPMRAVLVAKGVAKTMPEAGDWTGTQELDDLRSEMAEFGCRGLLVDPEALHLVDSDPNTLPEVVYRGLAEPDELIDILRYFPIKGLD